MPSKFEQGRKMAAFLNAASDIVLLLTLYVIYKAKKYHIFCDNFFTSVRLARDLLDNELYLCRRTHSNKTAFPANLKPNKQEVKALRRGESLYRRQGNIVVTVWKDKKLVSFISTQCDVRGDETVRRKQRMEHTSKFLRFLP